MEVSELQQRYVDLLCLLFKENFLDDQFTQLQQLQDESNPDFVGEITSMFFQDSEKQINEMSIVLCQEPVDYSKIDSRVHQLKGSSSSIGAKRVKNTCVAFRAYCDAQNKEGCLRMLQQTKSECYMLKSKVDTLLQLEQQIMQAGGTVPMMS